MQFGYRTLLSTLLLTALLPGTGCFRKSGFDRAVKLEQQGHTAQAIELFRDELAHTADRDRQRRSEIYFHLGECMLAQEQVSEAFNFYSRAVEADDSNRIAHLRMGELLLLSGSPERATEQAQSVLRGGNTNLDAMALLGAAASAGGNMRLARDVFQQVLEKDPTRIKVALSLAEILNREGDENGAREVLVKAAAAHPDSSAPWLSLGRLEETSGKVKDAEQAYRKAVSIEDTPETNLRLAQYLERSARVDEARVVLRHVDAIRPEMPPAFADFAFQTNRLSEAREGYLIALHGLSGKSEKDKQADVRARTVARLIEADLESSRAQRMNGKAPISALQLAREHLDHFRDELDQGTARLLDTEIAIASEDLPLALIHANAAVESAPDSPAAHYLLGVVKQRMSDPGNARIEWETALERDSDYIPARLALADLCLDQKDVQGALAYVVPVVREEPGNFRALMTFGRVLLLEKEYASARVIASRAEVMAPDSAAPSVLRGDIAMSQGNPGGAMVEYQKAVLHDPRSSEAIEGLTRAYRSGNVTRAMLLNIEKLATTEPISPTLLEIAGRLFAEHGWNADAARCLERALNADPGRSSAALELARVLAQRGDSDDASRYAARVPGLATLLLGLRAEQNGDYDQASLQYEAAVRAGDQTGIAANNLAWIYAEQEKNLDRALTAAERAVELSPQSASVLDTLGYVHLKRREYTSASQILERARNMARSSKSNDELAEIERHLSEAYVRSGQPERAMLLRKSGFANQ